MQKQISFLAPFVSIPLGLLDEGGEEIEYNIK